MTTLRLCSTAFVLLSVTVATMVACAPVSGGPPPSSGLGTGAYMQRAFPPGPEDLARSENRSQIERLMEAGRLAEAEALVDAAQGEPGYGSFLPLRKAEILARRGVKAEALALYLDVLRDPKMYWNPNSRELAPALGLALELGRNGDADALATRMIARPASGFYEDPGVRTPKEADTPKERLAYAYLAVGNDLWVTDPNHFLTYASKAHDLLPNSVPVLTQLAYAHVHRNAPGDRDRALALFRQAYSRASAPSTRAEIKKIAITSRLDLTAP